MTSYTTFNPVPGWLLLGPLSGLWIGNEHAGHVEDPHGHCLWTPACIWHATSEILLPTLQFSAAMLSDPQMFSRPDSFKWNIISWGSHQEGLTLPFVSCSKCIAFASFRCHNTSWWTKDQTGWADKPGRSYAVGFWAKLEEQGCKQCFPVTTPCPPAQAGKTFRWKGSSERSCHTASCGLFEVWGSNLTSRNWPELMKAPGRTTQG